MFIFLLQTREYVSEHQGEVYLFAAFSAIVWALWVLKVVLSRRYRPWTVPYETSTSVVIPVVDEPLDLFRDVLQRITEQAPTEVIVVINGARNPDLEAVCEEFPGVRWTWTRIPGKRNAVKIGTELSSGEITVLVDSDTVWTPGTLPELLKPFAEPGIGGVTTRQRILQPERSWITRWADWLENSRSLYSMPAQSVVGQVGCLPGRTIAFRRDVLVRVMHDFMTQQFLGTFLEVSDDRTLTNLTLKAGYRTVYQHTSLVFTDAPLRVRKLYKQQLRWARGSQYNTLRMLPWMLGHAPVLAVFFLADILLPFLLVGAIGGWVYRSTTGQGTNFYQAFLDTYGRNIGVAWVVGLMIASSVLSMAVRQIRHLQEKPSDFFRLPVFIIVSTAFLMPIRLIGFFRLAHNSGWGTRDGAFDGGDPVETPEPAAPVTPPMTSRLSGGRPSPPRADRRLDPSGQHGAVLLDDDPLAAPSAEALADADTVHAPSVATERAAAHSAARARKRARRPLNPYAAIPYLIGTSILALEALVHVL